MGILNFGGKPPTAGTVVSNDQHWQDARFGDAPEVVPGTGPELVPGEAPEPLYPSADWSHKEEGLDSATIQTVPRPWWKKRSIVVSVVVAFLVIIGLSVGLGVGLTLKDKPSSSDSDPSASDGSGQNEDSASGTTNDNSNNSSAPKVTCEGDLCQSILSLSVYEDNLFIVARTTENRITIRPTNTTLWEDDFVDLGETPGKLISQPSSFSWKVKETIPRLDVFAVSSPDFSVYRRHYSNAENWTEWEYEGSDIGSSVSICGPFSGKMDVWSTSQVNHGIYHDWWYQKPDKEISRSGLRGNTSEHGKMSEGENGWKEVHELGEANSALAVVCRPTDIQADVLWYDRSRSKVVHSAWNQSNTRWSNQQAFDGEFIGNPTVFSFDDQNWDFFGVQTDKKLYHLSWKTWDGGYSKLEDIGGSIASTPAAVSLKAGTIDLVALGTDGNLWHTSFDGDDWASEWEDLGIEARSAPTAIVHDKQVYITAVTKDNRLLSWFRSAEDINVKWKDSFEREDLGGDMSLEYFNYES
ncbi:hypothetical protein HJFPF1_07423 [Paramyrothecium foliicola]|nr:hypothetical protein HJFPF1_07423 [Paramyrothecium foliicola]